MPNLAQLHPVIVHFAIALTVAGVLLRCLSLSGRVAWAGPAAASLLLTSAVVVFAAARSGTDAHGPVERVPGAAGAVSAHEEWGQRAQQVFLVVGLLELAALALRSRGYAKPALLASALLGLGGLFVLYEAGEHGGELVYSYAGGVGIRTGAPEDVGRLLLAGLYQQAQLDRKAQHPEDAAALLELAARRFPADPGRPTGGRRVVAARPQGRQGGDRGDRASQRPSRRPSAAHAPCMAARGRVRERG